MPRKKKVTRGQGSVYKRAEWWWVTYSVKGKRYREPAETRDRQEALDFLARKKGQIAAGNFVAPGSVTIRALLEMVNDRNQLHQRASAYIEALRMKKHLFPVFGRLKVNEFSSTLVEKYKRDRLRVAQRSTVNRELALLHRAFVLGSHADPPLVNRVPHIELFDESGNVRRGFLEPPQYERLLGELPRELKLLCVFGYHLGMRRGALLRIRWSWVQIARGIIRFEEARSRNRKVVARILPIYGDMGRYLELQDRESEFLFARGSEPIRDFRESWKRACERAGLPALLFHDLRRSAAKNMRRAGIPESLIMALTGHRTRAMLERYLIDDETEILDVGARVGRYLEGKKGNETGTEGVSVGSGASKAQFKAHSEEEREH